MALIKLKSMSRFLNTTMMLVVSVLLSCGSQTDALQSISPSNKSGVGPRGLGQGADRVSDVADSNGLLLGLSAIGTDCEDSEVCGGGLCVPTDGGGICSAKCVGTDCETHCQAACPSGFVCVDDGDDSWACVPTYGALCRPCQNNQDCNEVTGLSKCVPYAAGSGFCGAHCNDDVPCPLSYVCQPGSTGGQCVLDSGVCAHVAPEPAPAPDPEPGATSGSSTPASSSVSVCYDGTDGNDGVCFPLVSVAQIDDADYLWPPAVESPDEALYQPPTHLLDLSTLSSGTLLAPDFSLGEFMQQWKGRWGVFSPAVVAHLQSVRTALEVPLIITSGFRSPGYNAPLPGAATYSRHLYGDAVDITAEGSVHPEDIVFACKNEGAYYTKIYSNHVHCDWRTEAHSSGFWHGGASKPGAFRSREPEVDAHVELPLELPSPGQLVRLSAEWTGFDEGTPWVQWDVVGPHTRFVVERSTELMFVPEYRGQYRIRWSVGGVIDGVLELPCH